MPEKRREPKWEQIGGDITAHRYGALLGKYNEKYKWLDVANVQNLEDSLRDDELLRFGAGYLVGSGSFDFEALDENFEWALKESGYDEETKERIRRNSPKDRRLFTAQISIDYSGLDDDPYDGTFGDAVSQVTGVYGKDVVWNLKDEVDLDYDPLERLREEGAGAGHRRAWGYRRERHSVVDRFGHRIRVPEWPSQEGLDKVRRHYQRYHTRAFRESVRKGVATRAHNRARGR